MSEPRVGVAIGDLRLPPKDALRLAAKHGFNSVELPVGTGPLAPRSLSASGRRHVRRLATGLGLDIASLAADIPGAHLTDPATADRRVDDTRRAIELAADLGVRVVTASVGALTHPDSGEPSPLAVEAIGRIGESADATGTIYALRPTHDDTERLAAVLDRVACPSVGVCLDPAAMVMIGVRPIALIERFADAIAIVHIRDATTGGRDRTGRETRLGDGHVPLAVVIAALDASGYAGAHIVRRTDTETPLPDLVHARDVVTRYLSFT